MAVNSPDLKAFLAATPFFGGLSDASLDLLISMLVELRFDVGASTRNHKSLRRRPLTRRWWTFDLVHTNGSASSL